MFAGTTGFLCVSFPCCQSSGRESFFLALPQQRGRVNFVSLPAVRTGYGGHGSPFGRLTRPASGRGVKTSRLPVMYNQASFSRRPTPAIAMACVGAVTWVAGAWLKSIICWAVIRALYHVRVFAHGFLLCHWCQLRLIYGHLNCLMLKTLRM